MRDHRIALRLVVVTCAVLLAGCKSSSSTVAASSAPPASSAAPSSTESASSVPGANPGSALCLQIAAEKAKVSQLSTTLGTAFASQDLATVKSTLKTYFAAVAQVMGEVESSMSSAPANVQAALVTVNGFFTQLQSAVDSAKSMQELQTSITGIGNTKQMAAASKTLAAYTTSQCGSQPTP